MGVQTTEAETDATRVFGLDVLAQGLRYLSGGHVTTKAWTIAAVTWRSIAMTLIDCPVASCGLCGQKSLASNRRHDPRRSPHSYEIKPKTAPTETPAVLRSTRTASSGGV